MTGKEKFKITYSKEAKEYIEKKEVEKYLDDFQDFMPRNMIKIYHNQLDDFIFDKMKATANLRIGVQIDERLLNKWVDMCIKLDNMTQEQIEDIAIRRYIKKLENKYERKLTKYKRAFEILKDKGFDGKEVITRSFSGYRSRKLINEEAELLEELVNNDNI